MTTGITYVIVPIFTILAFAGAVCDWRSRTIPNLLNLGFLLAGVACTFAFQGWATGLSALGHFVAALTVGMILYGFGLWGGGDAKFYSAAAAWFALSQFFALVLAISLAGLVLVIGMFATRMLRRGEDGKRLREVPYGVAIALGGIGVMALDRFG